MSYTYDAAGRRTSLTVAGQSAVSYTYDAADRLLTVTKGTKTVTGHGADTDIIVASAKAYLNALNKLAYWKSRKDDGPRVNYI